MAAENLDFDLRLLDSVSAPARKAAEALKKVDDTAKKAQDTIKNQLGRQFEQIGFAAARAAKRQQDAFAASWAKIGTAAAKSQATAKAAAERSAAAHNSALGNAFAKIGIAAERSAQKQRNAFANSWAKIGIAAAKEQKRQQEKHKREEEKAKEHSLLSGVKEGLGFTKLSSAAFIGSFLAEGAIEIGKSFIEGAEKAVEIVMDGVKDAFKAASQEENLQLGENISLGGKDAKEFREDIERFASMTGFDDSAVRKMMLPLRNAGLSQSASKQAFATASDIAAGQGEGGNQSVVSSLLGQFQDIYTRRGVSRKQLMALLGNVGGTIPDFYKELGKKLNVSAKEAEKKAEEGGLDPQLIMNMITGAQNRKQGGSAGAGGQKYAQTFERRWARLKELPEEYFKAIAESPRWDKVSDKFGMLLSSLDPKSSRGQRIIDSIMQAFDKVSDAINKTFTAENVDHFASALVKVVNLSAKLVAILGPILDKVGQLVDAYDTTNEVKKAGGEDRFINENLPGKVSSWDTSWIKNIFGGGMTPEQVSAYNARVAGPSTANKSVTVQIAPGAVVVQSAPGESSDDAHRRARELLEHHVATATVKGAERGAAEQP